MRTRTLLTTPPGARPTVEVGRRGRDPEQYSPALSVPVEPEFPGRFRRLRITLGVLVVLGALGAAGYWTATSGQYQDPALTDLPSFGTQPPAELPGEDVGG